MRPHLKLSAAERYFKREIVQRPQPHGLLTWRYLLPCSKKLSFHRNLWWNSRDQRVPRSLWFTIELFLWFRWVGISVWVETFKLARLTENFKSKSSPGLSKCIRSAWYSASLSIAWCINPYYIKFYGLHEKNIDVLDFIYGHETSHFHNDRNARLGLSESSKVLISDKYLQSQLLDKSTISIAPVLICIKKNDRRQLSDIFFEYNSLKLFLKTRSGARGEGAFSAWKTTEAEIRGQKLHGKSLNTNTATEKALQELLEIDDVIIQPRLTNHSQLSELAYENELIVFRYISLKSSRKCLCSTISIPLGRDVNDNRLLYINLEINPKTGKINTNPNIDIYSKAAEFHYKKIRSKLINLDAIPHWETVSIDSYKAHCQFLDIWAIAWDWIITPDGAKLLEGNINWGMEVPQKILGGALTWPYPK